MILKRRTCDFMHVLSKNLQNDYLCCKLIIYFWQMNDMESLRIDEELRKQKVPQNPVNVNRYSKDSGVVDIELLKLGDGSGGHRLSAPECERLKKTTLSNSLIDISEGRESLF